MTKTDHRRDAALHAHPLGFELRITDQCGEPTFTQVRESEPDCVQVAAMHHTAYLAKGWEPVE